MDYIIGPRIRRSFSEGSARGDASIIYQGERHELWLKRATPGSKMYADEMVVIRSVVGISFLILVAKVLAGVCSKYRVPEVVGEILAGFIFGPNLLGGRILFFGEPLIQINDITLAFAQIGGIIVLFLAGLSFSFGEITRVGFPALIIGGCSVIAPFFGCYYASLAVGYSQPVAFLVGLTMAVTSIPILARVLEEMAGPQGRESWILVDASLINTVLCFTIFSIVSSVISSGIVASPSR